MENVFCISVFYWSHSWLKKGVCFPSGLAALWQNRPPLLTIFVFIFGYIYEEEMPIFKEKLPKFILFINLLIKLARNWKNSQF